MQVVAVWVGVPYLLAKVVCAAAVFAVWSFPAQRRLVFTDRPQTGHPIDDADVGLGLELDADLDPAASLA